MNFYLRFGKRLFDIVMSVAGLLLSTPVLATAALAVKLTSSGPVLFKQARVGRNGTEFQILKFRSMYAGAESMGPGITSSGDARVTPIGRVLRKTKLDELPQLWNVLKGDMSLVGPRPELPCYVAAYTPEQRKVLTVRPGITDLASITYRNEEQVLERSAAPECFYREVLMPHKLALNVEYIKRMSLAYDLHLILRTFDAVFVPAFRRQR